MACSPGQQVPRRGAAEKSKTKCLMLLAIHSGSYENGEITNVTVEKGGRTPPRSDIKAVRLKPLPVPTMPLTFYAGENYTSNWIRMSSTTIMSSWYGTRTAAATTVRPLPPKDNGDGTYTIVNMPNADMHITINKMAKALDPDAVDVVISELDNKTMYMVTGMGRAVPHEPRQHQHHLHRLHLRR